MLENSTSRIETELEVKAYLQNLKYAIENGARIVFQAVRITDFDREIRYTNDYTMTALFPNEERIDVLKRELISLRAENYIRTVRDIRFPDRPEMREFGKVYDGKDVYIKVRVEVLGIYGNATTFVMSFHFAEREFAPEMFPYRK